MPKVIGITGGIATGKSTVLRLFGEFGAQTLSADDLAREVLARDGSAYHQTVEHFGDSILRPDGEIDRQALAAIVFADPDARAHINRITHPQIISAMQQAIDSFRKKPPAPDAVLALEIPLLVECGLESMVDKVVVVATEQAMQQSRLTYRSGLSAEDVERRIAAQMPIERKAEHADFVIWNNSSMEDLRRSCSALWHEIHLL